MKQNGQIIATVIVTHNRKELLEKCINAVRNQTKQSSIIVVNNGSTDSTRQWLSLQNDITVINQDNLGGAGGFHEGIKFAHLNGYKWLWIMDDDGLPEHNCLEILYNLALKNNVWYVAPNLIDFNGSSHFERKFKNSANEVIYDIGGPFNAILLNEKLIDLIGYPNKSFFIWGDEYEYTDRIIELGIITLTAKDAIHKHKKTSFPMHRCPRPYFFIRNRFWRYRVNKGVFMKKHNLKYEAWWYATHLLMKGAININFKQVKEVIHGIYDGLTKEIKSDYFK
ncbi:glycosyltransferase family 2 protein [Spirosoma oryzicola]|uniref:glycosyltransferase family 2 protein n=1 Tax=Spirosoma oryzicola TaxID=2898794 RepID=UPI001E3398A4|nr:glycosyltransferase family 2 protein [Spirosoma oryzicola]UHG93158.1 glycosyltransferase family 2 protein [Spirosoma oryzicola]